MSESGRELARNARRIKNVSLSIARLSVVCPYCAETGPTCHVMILLDSRMRYLQKRSRELRKEA